MSSRTRLLSLQAPSLSSPEETVGHLKQRVDVEVRLELHHSDSRSDIDVETDSYVGSLCKDQKGCDNFRENEPVGLDRTFDPNHTSIVELRSAVSAFIRTFPLLTDGVHNAPPTVASIRVPASSSSSHCQTRQSNRISDSGHPIQNQPNNSLFDTATGANQPASDSHSRTPSYRARLAACSRPFRDISNCVAQDQQQVCASAQAYLHATQIRICTQDAVDKACNTQDSAMGATENVTLKESQKTSEHVRHNRAVLFMRADIHIHLYHARSSGNLPQLPEPLDSLAIPHAVPHRLDDSLWHTLAFGPAHKRTLVRYIAIRRLLYSRQVDHCVIPSSGFVLLYGPPGTGKTTLCRAVATHFAIRHGLSGVFLHVRMDKLVSKWLGESAKLMAFLFEGAAQCAKNHQIVFLLLDEVESVARARSHAQSTTQSSGDEIRIVNAFLTALDGISQYSNVVVMATSNLLNDIDNAVVDRADMRLHVGIPHVSIIQHLILECVTHLVKSGIIVIEDDHDTNLLAGHSRSATSLRQSPAWLQEACIQLEGLSARQLRKLSIVALSLGTGIDDQRGMKLADFVHHLAHAKQLCAIQGDINTGGA